ncbi:MAG: efflux RND transporter periplasmic adaptor subunit [Rhizobiales bacterium]|nr:efflux RND transporter periplasmic adaptor subunit [Hyphomicrobiales bacterium]
MIKRSYLWAGVFALALSGWLASGELLPRLQANAGADKPAEETISNAAKPFRVQVQKFSATERHEVLSLQGRTESFKTLDVLVRTKGIVERALRTEGDVVKAGDLLCELDISDRKSRLAQAKAELASAQRDFEAAEKLAKSKFVSEAKLATERARLDAARATTEQMELDIKWTQVRAPIAGTVVKRPAEQGKYLKVGDTCAVLTVLDPILAIGQVNERQIGAMKVGSPASFKLISGQQISGKVRFIAPQADIATRTFRIEIEADNPGNQVRSGLTATIGIPLPAMQAHLLPSSLISLYDAGVIGVHTVQADNTVKFAPVKLLSQAREGAWVSGLPDEVTIITVGQHYVLDGAVVDPVPASSEQTGARS